MILGILALFVSSIIYGLTDVILKKLQFQENILVILIHRSGVSVLGLVLLNTLCILFPTYFIDWKLSVQEPNYSYLPIAILLSAISFFGLYFFMQALKYKSASETVGLNKIEIIIAIILGVLFYQEVMSLEKMVCILLIIGGIVLLEFKNTDATFKIISKGFWFILLARLCWSVSFLFIPSIKALGVLLFTLVLESVVFIMSWLLLCINNNSIQWVRLKFHSSYRWVVLIGLLGVLAEVFANISRDNLSVILLAFLSLITPITVLIFSKWHLQESLTKSQWMGIILGLLGSLIYIL